MGLDIYNLSNKAEFFGTVESLDSVEKELKVFKSKTELIIDEYGTKQLYLNHIRLFYNLTKDKSNNWSNIFKRAIKSEIGLLFDDYKKRATTPYIIYA